MACLLLPCFFLSVRLLIMCKPRITFYLFWQVGPPGLEFCGSVLARLLSWLGMLNAVWLDSIRSENFSQIKVIIFDSCLTRQATFDLGNLLHMIGSLFSYFCMFRILFSIKFWSYYFEILNFLPAKFLLDCL